MPITLQAQNFVYVTNRTATANTVSGFTVDAGGLLTPVAGSPFNTGGSGANVVCAAVDRITINLAKNLLFVTNSGDQSISVFQISPTTGVLSPVAGSPFASGLTLDSCGGISLAATPDGHFLMASANGVIKTFSVAPAGALTLSSTASPLPSPMVGMKISGDGRLLAVSHQSTVSVFTISTVDGSLTAVAGSPFPRVGTGLVGGVQFSCDGKLLYAGEGGTASSITDAWSVDVTGALTPIVGSPFTAAGSDSNIVFLTPDNTILLQSNQGSNDLNQFTVNPDGTLTTIGAFNIAAGHTPVGLDSDNSGLFLYAADDAFGVAVFNILPGVIPTLVADNPMTGAGQIQGVAAYPPRSCSQADFTVTQSATPNPVTAGGQITYTITITNHGPSAASVAINDLLPRASMTFVSCAVSANGVCDKGAGLNRTITFASLASGASGTATLVGATISTLLNGDTITNAALVSNSSAVDPNPLDNAATSTVTVSAPLSATNIVMAPASAVYFGNVNISAALHRTTPGANIAGRTLNFTVDGVAVGSAVTNTTGVAAITTNVGTIVPGGLQVGAHSIVATFTGDSQFAISTATVALTVTKAVLTVTAQPATKVYGDANPPFTFVISGFLNGETVAVVSGTATCSSSAGINTAVGPQTITCIQGTLAANNYSFAFVTGIMTITKAPLVLAGTSVTRLYGDVNPPITGTVQGLKAGDQATATFSSTALTTSPVGSYPINGVLTGIGGFNIANYTLTSSGTVTVNPAPLTVAAINVSRLYGDPNPPIAGTITGLKNSDVITGVFSVAADPTSAVGTYPITATLTDAGNKLSNYTVVSTGTLTVSPAPLSVVANNASRLYGDPNPAFTGILTGLKNGDAITANFTSTAVLTSPVGTYPIVASLVDPGGKAGNYTFTPNSGTLTVTQAPLSVTAADATRLYGDANPTFTGTIVGIKNTDNITATFATTATPASSVGSFPITPTLVDPTGKLPNYAVLSTNRNLSVTPAPLSASAANATRLYGDANPTFTGTISGIKNADNITATFATTATAASNVGSFPITITLADPTTKLGNYTVTLTNGSLTVSPAPLTVTGTNATRLYGDPNPALTGTITGIKNADNITATFASAATPASPVGTSPIVGTLSDPTNKLPNYTVVSNNGTLTITAAPLSVSAADATRVYGDPNPTFAGTITGLRNGDAITASFTSAATVLSNVGTSAILPLLADPTGKLGNYAVTSTNGTLTITQAPLTVTAGNATRVYGDPNPAFTGTIVGLKNGDNITATVSGAAQTNPVGTTPLVPALVDPNGRLINYSVTVTNGTLTITPAPLSVSTNNATRLYGDANPAFSASITGIKNADNITATFTTTATAASIVGTYTIVPTLVDPGSKLTNYTVTSTNGNLTVSPAPLTVSAANASRLYGDANPTFTGTITGIRNLDAITATFASAATPATSVGGTATIVPTLVDPGGKLTNYTVTSNNGTLTIAPAPLTVTGGTASRLYGDPNPALTGVISGIRNLDNITATFASPAIATTGVGPAPIVPTLVDPGSKLSNYTVTSINGVLTINPAPLTVTAGNATRLYGDPNPAFNGTVIGLKNNDNITVIVGGTGADPTSPVGSYVLVPTLQDPTNKAGNYAITLNNGNLTVTPAPLAISGGNATRAYGDANPTFTGNLVGLKNGDAITATFATTATLTSPVGTFSIVPTPVDAVPGKLSNYTVTLTNGTLTVSPAALNITAANATRLYGDANPTFTATFTGLKNGDAITASLTTAATSTSPVGPFAIVPAAVDSVPAKLGNYSVTLTNGTLTVAPAPLSITANPASRLYGDANPAFTGTISGIKNSDNITAAFTTTAVATTGIGPQSIVPSAVDPTAKIGNYTVTLNNGVLTISPAPLTVTAISVSRLYGDPNPAVAGTVTGLKNGDNITATVGGIGADLTTPVGTVVLIPALADPGNKAVNYVVTLVNGTLTITPAPLNIAANNATRLYGDANPSFSATFTGLKNNDAITASFATTATPASAVGTFNIVPAPVDAVPAKLGNYTVTLTNGTLTVAPAPLNLTATNVTRLYGDPNPTFSGTFTGLKNTDVFTATFSTTAIATSSVGPFSIVPAAVDSVVPKLANYTLTLTNGTLTVAPAPLSITANPASRLYGDANPAFSGTVTGIKNSDNITAAFATTAVATTGIGPQSIVPSAVDPTGKIGNYTVTLNNGVLTINPAPLTVTAISVSRLYGDPNPAVAGTVTGLKNGDNITATVGGIGADLTTPVGTVTLIPALVDPGNKAVNYTVTLTNGLLTITPAPLNIAANNATRLYGDANPALSATFTGLKNNDAITASLTTAATPASAIGTFTIVATPVDAVPAKLGNYTVTLSSGTLTVAPAPLNLTAANATRLYGDANPSFTGTFTGLKNNDTFGSNFTTAATPASSIGPFAIVPAAVDSVVPKLANYTLTLTNGTLTITAAPLTIAATPASRTYGDLNPALTGTITGVKNADAITPSFTTTAVLTTPAGPATIVAAAVDPTGKLGNYNLVLTNATLTINPAPLTVTATNQARLYGDPNPPFNGTIIGLKNGDNITAIVSGSGAAPTSAVGTYVLVPSLVDSVPSTLNNYTATFTNGTLTINPAPLSVSGNNATRLYGDPNPAFTATFAGLKNADNITASFSTAAQTASIGSYPIVVTPVDPGLKLTNYTLTTSNGTLSVTPAPLAVAAANATRIYGDPNPVFAGTITGVRSFDTITASFNSVATAASSVGTFAITPALSDPGAKLGNYTVTSTNGILTVGPAALIAAAANATRLYGDANPAFAGTVTGQKNGDVITATFSVTADPTSAVGTYPINPTFADPGTKLGNYTVTSSGTLTVTVAPLSVSAANASRIYGDANPAFTGTITGVRNADNITATFTSAGPTSAVGTYAIVPTLVDPSAKLTNYSVTSNNGTLTVTAAALTVTAANASRPYGSANPVLTGTIVGIKNVDPIAASFTSVANAASTVGAYPIVPALVDPAAKLTNYTVVSNNGTLTVAKATPPVTLNIQTGALSAQLVAVVQGAGSILPSGTVQFSEGGVSLGAPVALVSTATGAEASATVALPAGSHTITASYSGDATYTVANSTSITVVISQPQFALSGAGGNTSATVAAGQTATYNVSLASQGFSGAVALTCSGAPAGTTCTVNPTSANLTAGSANVPVTVTVATTLSAHNKPSPFAPFKTAPFVFAGILVGLASRARKQRKHLVLALLAFSTLGGLTACGGGSVSSSLGPVVRPPTSATLTLTGTSGAQTASITLNLTINHQ